MVIGIIAALDEEVSYVKESMIVQRQEKKAGFNFYFGTLVSKPVVLCQSGVGKVNAAICTTLLIEVFSCGVIINTGAAAGLSSDMATGDVVVSDSVMHHDVDVTAFGYELGQVPGMPLAYEADKALIDIMRHFSDPHFTHHMHIGSVIAADAFVCNTTFVKDKFPIAIALDMESNGIAQTCHRFSIPFIVIRSISDDGGEEAKTTHEMFLQIAGENSAMLARFLVGKL
ncbi:MAG: 5-methylthioadenosine nucleosidase : S-adenosylhomocysteine nucleosidase [Gammaproteobacteria bacterium]|nr:5-methylthioadenosine nucleosidase : S-adenosylhomocysteine nucleosidase [Gammaproteobacteria bacterium]